MKRLIIIVEGQTEEEFVRDVLAKYLNSVGIYDVTATRIQTSSGYKGGFVKYIHLKRDLQKRLKNESNIVVSTMLDFFQIPKSVPNYDKIDKYSKVDDKIDFLQKAMKEDINDRRFIPYIQKHEFEALLFSSNEGFELMFDEEEIQKATKEIVSRYDDPEEINDHPSTAPSKRLIRILKTNGRRYDKVVMGILIADTIGIETIIKKCPRFKNWLETIISQMQEE